MSEPAILLRCGGDGLDAGLVAPPPCGALLNNDVHDATTAHKERGLRRPQVPGPGAARVVDFNNGNCNNHHVDNNNYVRVVRSGKSSSLQDWPSQNRRLDQPLRRRRTLRSQVACLQCQFLSHLCLIAIGCYFEALDQDAHKLAAATGLRVQEKWRGFAAGCGFHRNLLLKIPAELKKQRILIGIVRETGRELYKTKECLPELIIEYPQG